MKYKEEQLRRDLITKRCIDNNMSMDEACEQIGISKATLWRLENSKIPDVETLGKCCAWLGTQPNKYFVIFAKRQDGFKPEKP
jgi:transcriptional regulator with XRE-family HTH domain